MNPYTTLTYFHCDNLSLFQSKITNTLWAHRYGIKRSRNEFTNLIQDFPFKVQLNIELFLFSHYFDNETHNVCSDLNKNIIKHLSLSKPTSFCLKIRFFGNILPDKNHSLIAIILKNTSQQL